MSEFYNDLDIVKLILRDGLPMTIELAILGFFFAMVVGFSSGLARYLRLPVLAQSTCAYVEIMRGLPFLMVVFFLYYVLPLFNLRMGAFETGVLALTLHSGAYLSEIVRSSLRAVPCTQHEAGKSLALSAKQRLQYIIIPQAIRLSLPPIAGQSVLHIKDTSVVSIIGLIEMTRVARAQMQTNQAPLFTFAILALLYFAICYPVLRFSLRMERKVKVNLT